MSEILRILQVEDSESDAELIVRLLEKSGYDVQAERVEDDDAMRAALIAQTWDVIIADYHLQGFDAPAALHTLHASGLDLPFIVVSGALGEDVAIRMMKAGAHDYLIKNKLARLAPAVEREIREAHVRQERRQAEESLRHALLAAEEANHRYHLVADQSRTMIWEVDAWGVYTYVSHVSEAVYGYRPAELIGKKHFYDIHTDKRREAFQLDAHEVLAPGKPFFCFEHAVCTGDGRTVWVSTNGSPVFNDCGEVAGYRGSSTDITERKRYEADRETMMTLLGLLNSPNDERELIRTVTALLQEWSECESVGILVKDGETFPHFETRGFPAEFVESGNDLCELDAQPDLAGGRHCNPAVECICAGILCGRLDSHGPHFTSGGSFWTNSLSTLPPSTAPPGSPGRRCDRCRTRGFESLALVPVRSSGRTLGLLQFSDQHPDRFSQETVAQMERAAASLAIGLEQRRTQAALRASEERYRLISENTADVIWLLDLDSGRYTYVSPSVQHLLGYSPEEVVGKTMGFALTLESHQFATSRLAETLAAFGRGDESVRRQVHQIEQVHKDGSTVHSEVATTLLPNRQGRVGEVLGVTRDVTERVQVEARLLQAQKLESVGRLAGGVAHDFNNLLTVINGYSDMLIAELSPNDPLHELATEIRTAGERAAALSGQLLVLSRKQVVQTREVNLNEIIVEVEKMLGRVIGEDIRLESVLSPTLGCVAADPGQLHQILMNLAVNARDAMPGGGTLLIETTNVDLAEGIAAPQADVPAGRYVQLKVSDPGVGMTKEVMSHLFEPFFTTKKAGVGTGLGLATVYGIVKQSGGSICVYSQPGHGTSFHIYLPRMEPAGTTRPEPARETATMRGTETILVVEDQDQLRKMAVRVLQGHGYNVLEAAGPETALLCSRNYAGPIHLLLTDVVMPDMTGPDLACRLKPSRPAMEVVFMSGYSESALVDRQVIESAGAYLAKPFSPESLAWKVRKVLGSPRAPA